MLRVTDVLIEGIINTVTAYDLQQHHQMYLLAAGYCRSTLNVLEGHMLNKLISVINSCSVQFHIWKENNNGELTELDISNGS